MIISFWHGCCISGSPQELTKSGLRHVKEETIMGNNLKPAAVVMGLTLILVCMALPAWAADVGTITVQGTVAVNERITVNTVAGYNSLDLTVNTGSPGTHVATVNERCNSRNGYTVTLASTNSGVFQGTGGNPDTLSYTVWYAGIQWDLSTGTKTVTDATQRTVGGGVDKDLYIEYSGAAVYLNADTYSDTLTFTLAAK
jgi:hypothetical protein